MDGTQAKFGLRDSICHHISRTARFVERRMDEALRRHGLTRISWSILLAVEEEARTNPSDIADFVGIDRTATSRALRQLEAEGLIAREMGREDRRMTEVSVTEKGRDVLLASTPLCHAVLAQVHDRLSEDEVDALRQLLGRLAELDPRNRAGF